MIHRGVFCSVPGSVQRYRQATPPHRKYNSTCKIYILCSCSANRGFYCSTCSPVVAILSLNHFAFYLQHLADTTKSKATVEEAVNAISWRHQLAGQPTINTSAFVHDTVVGLQQKGSVYCTTVKAARMQVEFLSSQNNESFLSCMQLYRSMRSRGSSLL